MNTPRYSLKAIIHCPLVNWWSILEPKWHDYPNENFLINDESNLIVIFWGNHDLVVIGKSI
jgi:hypothetical protein